MTIPARPAHRVRPQPARPVALSLALLLATAASLAILAARSARAQGQPGVESAVELTVVGDPAAFRWARSLVGARGLGGRAPRWDRVDTFDPRQMLTRLKVGDRDPAATPLRCWLDLTSRRRARLYFSSRSGERFLIRALELSGRFDAVDRESVAEALDRSVVALLEDDQAGITRAEAEATLAAREPAVPSAAPPAATAPDAGPARARPGASQPVDPAAIPAASAAIGAAARPGPVAAPARSPRSLAATVGVRYVVQAFSSDFPVAHGPGLVASFGQAPGARRWAGWSSVSFQWPESERRPEIGVSLETVSARAGIEVGRSVGGAWPSGGDPAGGGGGGPPFAHLLTARIGLGLDAVHVSPQPGTGAAPASLTPSRWSSGLALTLALGDAVPIGRRAYVAAWILADVVPAAVDYQVSTAGRIQSAFSTWRLRPGLAIEIGVY